MTEEQNAPITPAIVGKPPLTFEAQLERMSLKQLAGETRKLTRASGLNGAIAMILQIAVFKKPFRINDPYLLDSKNRAKGGFDMQNRGPRPPKPEAKK